MKRWLSNCLLVAGLVLIGALLGLSPAAGQSKDDQIVVANAVPDTADQSDNFDLNFDQWIYPGAANAAAGRRRMEAQAKLQLIEIERCCQLTGEQKARLELAARGDFQRFNEKVEAIRRKFAGTNLNDGEKMNQVWQEIQPLQVRHARGISAADTLLAKAVQRTLDHEQSRQYDDSQLERRRFQYEAGIALALHTLDQQTPLTSEQRQKLTKLLIDLPPPKTFGQNNQWLVLYRLANLPPSAKVQAIFDPRQWQALQQQFQQAKAMKQQLLQEGYLTEDRDVKPDVPPAAQRLLDLDPEAKPAEEKP